MRDIAGAVGRRLKLPVKSIVPEETQAFFGWLAMFAGRDMPASIGANAEKAGMGANWARVDSRSRKVAWRVRSREDGRMVSVLARTRRTA